MDPLVVLLIVSSMMMEEFGRLVRLGRSRFVGEIGSIVSRSFAVVGSSVTSSNLP